ncbi:MAG: hypothetical protein AB7O91_03930 [Sphingomonas sp.]
MSRRSVAAHETRPPLSPTRRRHIHGPVQPMDDGAPSWRTIGIAVLFAVAVIAFTWLALPWLADMTIAATATPAEALERPSAP